MLGSQGMRWNTVSVGCGAKFRRLIQSDWARGSLPDVTARDLGTSTISYHWLNSSRWQDLESLASPLVLSLRVLLGKWTLSTHKRTWTGKDRGLFYLGGIVTSRVVLFGGNCYQHDNARVFELALR
ncbi:hypothetical protein CDAR_616681 [Caerostris darwini]|uniref:Uncharacterized protein n=1 Tax=Caerostris darwini TaxID=1538125 RepID=A0AAV4VTD6_9ARAC|nr:hypothetical protein CDAR_616681 [Caerostris darwini]